ncbi:hypothetical protein VU12_14280 [Desulfobulbus sp. US4]|nr:hypothetical protein [Desulfobulbus sp. US4]
MASLTQKDRRALLIGISALVVFILVQFVFFPLLDQRKRLAKGIGIKEKGLAEMRAMQTGISQLSHRSDTLEQRVAERRKDFDLFAFLEKKSTAARVKENISYMKPSDPSGEGSLRQVTVEMKFKSIKLDRLVAFLELIESPQHIVELKKIITQVNKKEHGTLDVTMWVISLIQAEEDGV